MTDSTASAVYPIRVEAELDPGLSRGLWLVKWILAIPHYVVLLFLWAAFAVTSVLAFVSIIVTARYPRSLFEFNVGVLRWTWRVAYYAYGTLGTDRYPPFTLAEVPDYPAHLAIDYPEHLSRGLVLVKWWLLAIPHYLVVGLFIGGLGYGASGAGDEPALSFSLVGILVLVAGVVLLFTGRYPRGVFDLLLGLNRWVLRVAGYVALMTDRYPPFSLDQGGQEPDAALAEPVLEPRASRWSAGRALSLVVGSILVLLALGLGAAGTALAVVDQTGRDSDGVLMSPEKALTSDSFAITTGDLQVHDETPASQLPERLVGDVRFTATSLGGAPVFLGVAATADVDRYLAMVRHDALVDLRDGEPRYRSTAGGAPSTVPSDQEFWLVQDLAVDRAEVIWELDEGDWTVVVMNADGSFGVAADVAAGAEFPALPTVIAVLLVSAAVSLLAGIVLMAVPLRSVSKEISAGERS